MKLTEHKSLFVLTATLLFGIIESSVVRAQEGADGQFLSGRIVLLASPVLLQLAR